MGGRPVVSGRRTCVASKVIPAFGGRSFAQIAVLLTAGLLALVGRTAPEIRLMSYNVRHCQGLDGRLDVERTARRIASERPDFVGLQEIDCKTQRVKGIDESEELARLTGMTATFARAIPYEGGEYGVAILSRTAPLAVDRTPLPGREPRVLLLCEFEGCVFGTTHLAVDSEITRTKSVEIVRDRIRAFSKGKPTFLTGDWNSLPESDVLKGLGSDLTVLSDTMCQTFHGCKEKGPDKQPVDKSRFCIDYIAVDSAHAKEQLVADAYVVEDRFTSDHAPIMVAVVRDAERRDVTDFGAKGDGETVNTVAIQRAIDAAASTGGGMVWIPRGTFVSGALFFKPGTGLGLAEGAVLKGSENIADYPERMTRIEGETCRYVPALVNAERSDGFSVCGRGTIDGNGGIFWKRLVERQKRVPGTDNKDEPRPRLLYVANSRDITVEGVTLKNAAFWTTHFYKCENVTLSGLKVFTEVIDGIAGKNPDAVDLDGARNVTIRDTYMDVPNDAITLKGGKGPLAHDPVRSPESGAVSDVTVEGCSFGSQCTACLTFGSECFAASNVVLRNCRTSGAVTVLRLKMRPDTRQDYAHVRVEGVTGVADHALIVAPYTRHTRTEWRDEKLESVGRDVRVKVGDLICRKGMSKIVPSEDYRLEDVDVEK